jgi:hypothetical protein
MPLRAGAGQANEVRPQSVGAPGRAGRTLGSLRDPDPIPSWEAAMGDIPSTPESFDVLDPGSEELGLPGFPRALLLPTSWGQVVGGMELACS